MVGRDDKDRTGDRRVRVN